MSEKKDLTHLLLPTRPSWDRNGGNWVVSPIVPKDGPTPMCRFWPSIDDICGHLMGATVHYKVKKPAEQERYRNYYNDSGISEEEEKNYFTGTFVHFPGLYRRLRIYREGLELVIVLRNRSDLFSLAIYRRQVSEEGGIWVDALFLEAAESFNLTAEEWNLLAAQMPESSRIRVLCERNAYRLPIAAE